MTVLASVMTVNNKSVIFEELYIFEENWSII